MSEPVTIRRATVDDEAVLRELWEEFELEVPDPEGFDGETWEEEWRDTRRDIEGGATFVAEDGDGVIGVGRASAPKRGVAHIHLVHVRPRARRRGVTKTLLRAVVEDARERGARLVSLNVLVANEAARAVWRRLGFEELSSFMATPLESLEQRLAERTGPTAGTVYVQTDDEDRVAASTARFLPRLGRPEGTEVAATGSGWVAVREPLLDSDPKFLQRLAQELSLTTGAITIALGIERGAAVRYAIYDRGGMVDEYLSVPELYGPLPPGDVIALGANPRVVARLTGADPDRVREVAVTAVTPEELPPPEELRDQLVSLLGLG
jgi:ribosomal protein S18 acetylase RimI-like enzyme